MKLAASAEIGRLQVLQAKLTPHHLEERRSLRRIVSRRAATSTEAWIPASAGMTMTARAGLDENSRRGEALERFRLEARAASALNHPNIFTIHDIGDQEGRPFILMEMMEGATLKYRIEGKPIKFELLLDWAIEPFSNSLPRHEADR